MQRSFPSDMTTDEALEYLNLHVTTPITRMELDIVRGLTGIPVAEWGTNRLWYRRRDLDAFLAELGTDPAAWWLP